MTPKDLTRIGTAYARDGYVSPVRLIDVETAAAHRARMEAAEAQFGPLHYRSKAHTILTSPWELATNQTVLDIVEQMIGPDILLFNVTYITKEAGSTAHVGWHQDLTYWGLSHDDQVSMWLALSPATAESGCMRMVPGSHKRGRVDHEITHDETSVLLQGQKVNGVSEETAVLCPLEPGEASFHHGWTLHASMPNVSQDRRIGLNIQYIAPHVRQTKHDRDTAILVRGEDRYHHFEPDVPATSDLDPVAVQRQAELEALHIATAGTA
jgi:ectoine hydroxylase-related dioxygenase (phytanoyl-CoA dioxygenase family)